MTGARRAALADTITSVLFFSLMGALTETLVARMSLDQVLVSRLAALPVMVLSGRPYGLYRDALLAVAAPAGAPRWRVALADTVAFVTLAPALRRDPVARRHEHRAGAGGHGLRARGHARLRPTLRRAARMDAAHGGGAAAHLDAPPNRSEA